MFSQYDIAGIQKQTPQEESQSWAGERETYLTPSSQRLDASVARRVVGNLTAVVAGIVQTRAELTTSELGSAITGPGHAEAGTQRLQRALHHAGGKAGVSEAVLWEQAQQRRQELEHRGETPLCIWDSSVLEKPESEHLQGWGAVRCSRVRRLARSRKGVCNRPSGMQVGRAWVCMGKPAGGRQKGQAAGGSHDLVGTRARSRGPTTPTAREEAFPGRTTVGRQGVPGRRIAGTAPVPGSGGSPACACAWWCGSPERQQAA